MGQGSRIVYFPSNYCIDVTSIMSVSCKRKFEEVEEKLNTSPTEQRKNILDISMTKLRTSPHRKVEPSLRRSVLIFNTLKNIENQLKLEGVCVPKTSTADTVSNLVPALQVPASSEDILDALPNAQGGPHYHTHGDPMDYQQTGGVVCSSSVTSALPHSAHSSASYSTSYSTNSHHINASHYNLNTTSSPVTCDTGQTKANYNGECPPVKTCSYGPSELEPPSSSIPSAHMYPVTLRPPSCNENGCSGGCSENTPGCQESVLSDTSKFILDSILSSDKLVSVASFTSLFELDNNELLTGSNIVNTSNDTSNLNNNSNSSNTPSVSQTTEGIPPISCLCSKNLTRSTPYRPPSWSQSADEVSSSSIDSQQQSSDMCEYSWSNSSSEHLASSSSSPYHNCTGLGVGLTDSSHLTSSVSPPPQAISDWNPAFQGLSSPTSPLHAQSATSCRQESSYVESQNIFGDVDCTSFDFDLFLPSLSPSMKLTQLNHEDLLHSLPSPDVGFGSNCNSTPSLLNPKTDSHGDELDRIMQIVVGI